MPIKDKLPHGTKFRCLNWVVKIRCVPCSPWGWPQNAPSIDASAKALIEIVGTEFPVNNYIGETGQNPKEISLKRPCMGLAEVTPQPAAQGTYAPLQKVVDVLVCSC